MGKVLIAKAYPPYSTSFALTENPISEGGKWLNGLADGLDWADVKTANGVAVGTQIYNDHYNDSTAILQDTWAADQRVRCTVYKSGTPLGQPEIEIRLRSSLAAHVNEGYECLISLTSSYDAQIVRWDGLDDFHYINEASSSPVINDGDTIEAEIVGGHIKFWHNGILITEADDSVYLSGNPGIGFWNTAASQDENDKYGFKDFQAWEL